jgi:tRNA pseudouridine55 synthase
MDGVLVIDKPIGPTSHDVVARVRRAVREKRIGHTGTLDPLASGVLPLVIGRATRLSSLLSSSEKAYEAGVRLGAATDTYDATGLPGDARVPSAPDVQLEAIEAALDRFRGPFEQVPPAYSAKKVAGVAAYTLARRQQPALLKAVPVATHTLDVVGLDQGLLTLRMVTTPGFYVRSLAHDLGQALGCGAYLESLRRLRAGAFDLSAAVPLEEVERDPAGSIARLVPLDQLLPEIPAVTLSARGVTKASHGNPLGPGDLEPAPTGPDPDSRPDPRHDSRPDPGSDPVVRMLGPDGALLGLARQGAEGLLRPFVVLV